MSALSLVLDTDDLAKHYDQVSADRQFASGRELTKELSISPGEAALDIGSGTGLLAAHVAGLVGPTGSVIGIDPLPLRVELAKQKAQPNLHFEVGNAYDLGAFADASFDVVYLNAVFHWLPEKRGPLRQIARVLKKGGRLGVATGSREPRNLLQSLRAEILAREPFNQYPESLDGVPHHVTAGEIATLFEETGFAIRKIEVIPNENALPSPQAAILFFEASSFGNFLGHLPETVRPQARAAIEAELERLRTPNGIPFTGARIRAFASKR
jgi:ubiquinone/menaquinone biosynthesis C-methylase UbiE